MVKTVVKSRRRREIFGVFLGFFGNLRFSIANSPPLVRLLFVTRGGLFARDSTDASESVNKIYKTSRAVVLKDLDIVKEEVKESVPGYLRKKTLLSKTFPNIGVVFLSANMFGRSTVLFPAQP